MYTPVEYRLQACDLLTGTSLCWDLGLTVTSVSRGLNDAGGALSATGSLRSAIDLRSILNPQKTALWLWRNEVPVWGGILWTLAPDVQGETISIGAEGFMSYLSRVRLLSDQTFVGKDQLNIARALIDYAQGRANSIVNYANINTAGTVADTGGSDIGLQYDSQLSGVFRNRNAADGYAAAQTPVISDLVSNLAGVIDGFQWYEDVQYAGPGQMPTPFVQFGYPQFNRTLPIRLEFPGNIETYTPTIDGTTAVNRYIAIGSTNTTTNATLIAIRNNAAIQAAGYPVLMGDSGSNYTDVIVPATLDAHAVEDLATVAGNAVGYQVVTRGSVFGTFNIGDTLPCHFESVWDKVPIDVNLQSVQWTLQPGATTQDEILTIDMAPVRSL